MGVATNKWSVMLDVDCVLNDLIGATVTELWERYGTNLTLGTFIKYEIEDCVDDDTVNRIYAIWNDLDFWERLLPAPGAEDAVAALVRADLDVYIMSSCGPNIAAQRVRWLAQHFPLISGDNIIFGKPKWLFSCDFIVEDRLETLLKSPTWMNKVLIDKPWNRKSAEYDECHGIVRVGSISGAAERILEIVDDERNW